MATAVYIYSYSEFIGQETHQNGRIGDQKLVQISLGIHLRELES